MSVRKRMWKTGLLLSAALAFTTSSVDARQFNSLGVGNTSCGQWLQSQGWTRAVYTGWVQGYLTAYNIYGGGDGNVTRGTDVAGYVAWVDNYCSANPLEDLRSAADRLIGAFQKRQK
jgi:hypothetical protein